MASKKVCKKCKILVEGNTCPICKGNQFTDSWKGRIIITDPEKSIIAKKAELKIKGEYAVKV
ncbi:DNA-directed RNA polymerase subunit E'' [Candidatus Woesearchaeota archaeon]|jgi:DNA-directed RNA polymerase subunit E"|nr:DNA-directed RNA polymerase subunit E'' [Candidatus Woesearchaeota archaeon]MBT7237448.1 DNA-directed RNA polymerase subunit E'' [Candidatus Woesearchaeota archaeon]